MARGGSYYLILRKALRAKRQLDVAMGKRPQTMFNARMPRRRTYHRPHSR